MKYHLVSQSFYLQPTDTVARELLGKIISREIDGKIHHFRIVETEAYLGLSDPSAHSYSGKITNRTKVMNDIGGTIYIYLIYGLHLCLNVVTQKKGIPEAVLIRALEPMEESLLRTNGPGLLGNALQLRIGINGRKVFDPESPLRILYEKGFKYSESEISVTGRIGIDRHVDARTWPLRFLVNTSKFVSKGKPYVDK